MQSIEAVEEVDPFARLTSLELLGRYFMHIQIHFSVAFYGSGRALHHTYFRRDELGFQHVLASKIFLDHDQNTLIWPQVKQRSRFCFWPFI